MQFQRLGSDKLSEKAIDQITGMINKGLLKPGDRLPCERELALQLGISRGILREALKTLERLGYLSRKPRGGTCIRQLTNHVNGLDIADSLKHATYFDYLETREMLEQKVVELAIKRASDRELEEIDNSLNLLVSSRPTSEIVIQFHYMLALTTKNIILSNFMLTNYQLHKNFVMTTDIDKDENRKKMILAEHKAILDAIKARNLTKAQRAMAVHLNKARHNMQKKTQERTCSR